MNKNDDWRLVAGHPDYEVSGDGLIRCRVKRRYLRPGQMLRIQSMGNGYQAVHIDGRVMLLHRLVCAAFHGASPSPLHEVAHFNGIRADNRATNLRWATCRENAADRKRHGTNRVAYGEDASRAILTEVQVLDIRSFLEAGQTQAAIANLYGVSRTTISAISNKYNWRHL